MTTARRALAALFALAILVSSGSAQPGDDERTLRVGTKVVRPFAFRDADGGWTGISIDLWEEIARRRGYHYEWIEAANTNELVAWVGEGRVDVGIAAITMKPSRAEVVDFSNSMYKSGVGVAVRSEDPGVFSLLAGVFSARLLGAIGGLCLLLLLIGALVWTFERRSNPDFERDAKGLWSGFWWSAVTMTTVGYGDKAPRTVGGRMLGLVWMFSSILMISGFTAVIASSLTTQRLQFRVTSADDLHDVSVGAKSGESPAEILANRGITPVLYESLEAGLRAAAAGEIAAFVHDRPVLQYEIRDRREFDEVLHVLPFVLREEEYGVAVRPTERSVRNTLREDVNAALLEIKIAGELAEIESRYLGVR